MTRKPSTSLRRSLALSTALGVSLGIFTAPAAAQLPVVTTFGVVTPGGVSGEAGAAQPVITSNPASGGTAVNFRLNARSTVLNWASFNIPQVDTANFVNATSTPTVAVLNRVTVQNPVNTTQLNGRINAVNSATGAAGAGLNGANGVEVWISNPNGILMGASGNFNTQGFIATTRSFDATDVANFLTGTGQLTLTAPSGPLASSNSSITGSVASIKSNGRVLAFIAPVIQVSGAFDAGAGSVAFVTASDVTIASPGSPLAMTINAGTALQATNGAALQVGGTVQGGAAYFLVSAQAGVDALLNVSAGATSASASGGVLVLGGRRDTGSVGSFTFANTGNGNNGGADVVTSGALTANGGGTVRVSGTQSVTVSGALATVGGGNVEVVGTDFSAGNVVAVRGPVTSSGGYSVTGGQVVLGAPGATVTQQAAGAVVIRSQSNSLTSSGTLLLNGDTDGSGDPMQLRGRDGIDFAPTAPGNAAATVVNGLGGGTAAGAITFDTDTAASVFRLGNVRAGTLNQFVGGTASAGLSRTGAFSTGNLTLSGANTLTTTGTLMTGAVTTGGSATTLNGNGLTVTGAIGNIAGQTGGVTINGGPGGAIVQSSDLAGALSVTARGVQFTDLAGVGAKTITSTAGISGANIAGSGAVTLSAAAGSPFAITGMLGTSSSDRLGALTVTGAGDLTLGTSGSTGVIGWLTTAAIGQGGPLGSLTARGAIDHSGAFTSATTNATALSNVVSGGALSLTTTTGPALFGDLSGPGSKSINSGGAITGVSIKGAGAVDLAAPLTSPIAVTATLGAPGDRLGALTVNGGSEFRLNSPGATGVTAYLSSASVGQTTPVGALRTFGAVDVAGAFTASASSVAVEDVVSGGALLVNGGVGGATFRDLTGAGTKTIAATGPIGIRSVSGAGAVTLSVSGISSVISVAQGIGAAAAPVDALTIDGGNVLLNGFTVTGTAAFGQTKAVNGLVVTGAADTGSLVADAAGAIGFGSLRAQTGDLDLASIGGGISFTGPVDGPGALVVQAAPTATVIFGGPVGSVSPFTQFASRGNALVLLGGGSLATTGLQRYDGRLVLEADTVLTGAGATFAGGVIGTTGGGAHNLALNFSGAQTLDGGSLVGIRDLATDTVGAPAGGTTLNGVFQTSGSQAFNDAVTLAGATELRSTGAASNITFGNTVNGAAALTVVTPGVLTFRGDVGVTTALASLAAGGANQVAIQGERVNTAGGQAYGSTFLNGALTSAVTLNAGADGVSFGELNGPRGLVVNTAGVTNLAGGATPLDFLTTDAGGTTLLAGTIGTVGTQTYNDVVSLSGATTLNGALAVFGAGVTGNGNDLTINTSGVQELSGIAGVNNLVTDAQVFAGGAGTLRLTGSVVTSGDQRYGDAQLIVAADAELKAGADKTIDIAAAINGDGETHALTLTAGQTRLRNDVGAAAGGRLAQLTVNGGLELAGPPNLRINTVGVQTYNGPVRLGTAATFIGGGANFVGGVDGGSQFNDLTLTFENANTLSSAFSNIGTLRVNGAGATTLSGDVTTRDGQFYDSAVVLGEPVTLSSGNAGAITLKTVTGAQALTINTAGVTTFDRALSGLGSITTDAAGSTVLNAGLSATGAITLGDAVELGADVAVLSTGGGALSFGGTVTKPYALTVGTSGLTTFGGAVGAMDSTGVPDATLSPTSLTSSGSGPVLINGGAITTSGAQRYAGQVRLGANTVLTGSLGTFGSGIAGNGRDLALYFANGLSVSGAISGVNNFIRGGGGSTALAGTIDTVGGQTYVNNVTLLGDTVLTSGGGTGTGAISFLGTVDGGQSLTVTSGGVTTFNAAVGATAPLSSINIGVGGLIFNGGTVTTTGAQSYAGPAILAVDTRLRTGGGDIAFGGTVDGARLLSLNAGAGAVSLGGRVGGVTALTGLAIRADSATAAASGNRVDTVALQLNTGVFDFGDAGPLKVGTVDGLVGVTAGGATRLSSGGLLTLDAPVNGGTFLLVGTGVLQNAGAAVTSTGTVTIDANDGAITLNDQLTASNGTGGGFVRLFDATDVRIGAITTGPGGTVVLGGLGGEALSGTLTQGLGVITTGTVIGTVGGAALLTNRNLFGTLGAFSAHGLQLRVADGLTVTGPVNTGAGGLLLQNDAGAMVLRGDVTTQGTATLISGGAISQTAGGITAASLTGSSVGGFALTSATNAVPVLAGFINTGGGGIAFTNSVALSMTADLAGGAGLALSAPGLFFDGRLLSAAGDVSLDAGQAALSGGTVTAGGNLLAAGGSIGLTAVTAGKGLTLTAGNGGLTVSGAVAAGGDAVATATGAVALGSFGATATPIGGAATIKAGGALDVASVDAVGPVTLTAAGAIGAGTLAGGSVKATGQTVDVGVASANTTLALSATGGALLVGAGTAGGAATLDASGALTVGTSLTSGGDVTLDAGGLATIKAVSSTGGNVTVQGGSLSVDAANAARSLVVAARTGDATLTAATSGGDATVNAAGAATVGTLNSGGVARLIAGGGLSLGTGNVTGAATLAAAGPLTVTTSLTSGGAASLTTGGTATVASINSTGAGVAIAGADVTVANAKAAGMLAVETKGGALSLTNGAAGAATLTSAGALAAGNLTTAGAATLSSTGPLTVTSLTSVGAASLTSSGIATVASISSTGAGVAISGADVSVGSAKAAKTLAIETKGGALSLTDGTANDAALTSAGALTAGTLATTGTASLSATGPLTIATSLTSGGATSLTTAGTATVAAVTSTGASIAITGGAVSVANAKAAGMLAVVSKSGALSLTDAMADTATLTSTGALAAGKVTTTGAATLSATGPLDVTTSLTSGGAANLTSGGTARVASITGAGVSITGADVSVVSAKSAGMLAIGTTGGPLSLANGAADAATLTSTGALTTGSLTTTGAATLSATGPLAVTTSLTSGGAASLTTGGAATVAAITSTGSGVSISGATVSVADAKAATALAIETKNGALSLTNGAAGTATLTSAGTLNTGSLTTSGAATLSAAGPLTVATALTSGGAASLTTTGNATVAAITSTNAGVSVTGAGVSVANAKAAGALALNAKSGPLALTSGTAGTATLTSAGPLNTGVLTTTGAATLTATGAATLGQSAIGAALTVTGNGISAGQTNAAALTMTSGGAITVTDAQVGGDATFDANGLATLGAVTAGSAGTITVKALDAAITGTQRAGTVLFVNRAPTSVATKLGNNTSAGGFQLSAEEVNNVEAGQLAVDAAGGSIEIGALALDADAGRTRVDLMTTGRIDVLGTVSGSGAGRTVRLGGSTTSGDDKASVIAVVATPTGGGRLLMDTADLELRGTRIGVGQATGFLDPLGLRSGAGAGVGTVAGAYVGDANSALYNSAIGGFAYPAGATLIAAKSLTVRYTDYALFQNTGAPGQSSGVSLATTSSAPRTLVIQGPGGGALNAFALFGTIGGVGDTNTALLGPSIIPVTGANLSSTRVNGCLVGSGAGCLTAVVVQPLLSTLDSSRTDVFRPADDLAVPFDPVVGTGNESLFTELGPLDDNVTSTQCSADTTNPGCRQKQESQK